MLRDGSASSTNVSRGLMSRTYALRGGSLATHRSGRLSGDSRPRDRCRNRRPLLRGLKADRGGERQLLVLPWPGGPGIPGRGPRRFRGIGRPRRSESTGRRSSRPSRRSVGVVAGAASMAQRDVDPARSTLFLSNSLSSQRARPVSAFFKVSVSVRPIRSVSLQAAAVK